MSIFISFEGIDASGKHTQSDKLKQYFIDAGRSVTKMEFPMYESVTGQMIKDHVTGVWKATMLKQPDVVGTYTHDPSTYLFQCCQLVNRMETIPDELWDRTGDGVFISDRFNASAYAYGLAFGLDFDWLIKTHKRLPQPDLNILLDIPVEESFRRRPDRRDDYEKNAPMLENVRRCYLEIFQKLGPSYVVVDASGTLNETFKKIIECVKQLENK